MIRRRVPALILMLSATILVGACITPIAQTSVDRVAKAKSVPNAPYSKVMVVGIAKQGTRGREFEEQLVKELGNNRTYAFGYRRAASRADVKQEVVQELLETQGADAVIFVSARLASVSTEELEERVDLEAKVRGGGLVNFFRYDYENLTKPADSTMLMKLQFVTNVFDVKDDRKVYMLESATGSAESTSEVIMSEAAEIASRLRKDKIVR
ncbi:MAG: hypothetical protein ACR2QX_03550 [Woeseiaceae bacterium]